MVGGHLSAHALRNHRVQLQVFSYDLCILIGCVLCALFCSEHNLLLPFPNSPVTEVLFIFVILFFLLSPCSPLRGPAVVPLILCGALQIDVFKQLLGSVLGEREGGGQEFSFLISGYQIECIFNNFVNAIK